MTSRKFEACCMLLLWAPWSGGAPAAEDRAAYRVVADESELEILVFRAGALAGLGHNHIITSHGLTGSVLVGASPADSAVELSMPVASLMVDEPDARAAAGSAFEGEVSDGDREGTRRNMLGKKVLDAERHDRLRVVSNGAFGEFQDMTVHAEIEIRGTRHEVDLPVSASFHGDRLIAVGRTDIAHSELGLRPFTAGLGTLRVAEEITLRYRIVATRCQ
jgi:hypothetical protein